MIPMMAQKSDSSPYSALGIGSEVQSKTVRENSMGGTGTASISSSFSFSNPASYGDLELSRYTLSGENKALWLQDQNASGNTSNAYFSYLAVGIPLGKRGGFAFGTQHNSTIGYSINQIEYDIDGSIAREVNYEGDGGTNRVFLGFGFEVAEGLNLGLEGKYIFGKGTSFQTDTKAGAELSTRYKSTASGNGFGYKLGATYKRQLGTVLMRLGTSVELQTDLDISGDEYIYSIGTNIVARDTILDRRLNGFHTTPFKTNIGVSFGDARKWELAADLSFRDAISHNGDLIVDNGRLSYNEYYRASIGGAFTPRYNSLTRYWKRIEYRAGMYFEQTGLQVKPSGSTQDFTGINKFGISFGMGLPVGKRSSKLETSFEYAEQGTTTNGLTQERIFMLRFALEFSDKWFKKREIN